MDHRVTQPVQSVALRAETGEYQMDDILIGKNDSTAVALDPHFGNRHGMVASALQPAANRVVFY